MNACTDQSPDMPLLIFLLELMIQSTEIDT